MSFRLKCILCVTLSAIIAFALSACSSYYKPTKFKIGECFSLGLIERWKNIEDPNQGLIYKITDIGIEHYRTLKGYKVFNKLYFRFDETNAVWEDNMFAVKCPQYFSEYLGER